jgi:osmotically-inducible protein OsmY
MVLPPASHSGRIEAQPTARIPQTTKPDRPDKQDASPVGRQIRRQLQALPFYSVFDWITFSCDGKSVTLSGQVLRPTLKAGAVSAIKSIEGVEAVTDQIEVLPKSPADDDLRRTIYRAIFEDATLAPYAAQQDPAIHIVVKNGGVTLEGRVKSLADKNLVATRARNAAKVMQLKNNLAVPSMQTSDERDVR